MMMIGFIAEQVTRGIRWLQTQVSMSRSLQWTMNLNLKWRLSLNIEWKLNKPRQSLSQNKPS